MISEVTGMFTDFEIEATADDAFSEPSFNVIIQTASVNTHNERRDNHLRSDDFFGTESFPTISFASTSYEKTGENTFNISGDLTMHGVTKPVTLEGKLNGVITDKRSQKLKAGLKLQGKVNRKDFGVGSKPFPVGEEVAITVNLEMAQQ
jgi:polyisoprenoid-binding protein YceI